MFLAWVARGRFAKSCRVNLVSINSFNVVSLLRHYTYLCCEFFGYERNSIFVFPFCSTCHTTIASIATQSARGHSTLNRHISVTVVVHNFTSRAYFGTGIPARRRECKPDRDGLIDFIFTSRVRICIFTTVLLFEYGCSFTLPFLQQKPHGAPPSPLSHLNNNA